MGHIKKISPLLISVILIILWLPGTAFAETVSSLGDPTGYVNDYAGVISKSDERTLISICEDLVAANSVEMAIVTINTTGSLDISDFTFELFNTWGIGGKEADNGLLILAAIDDHEFWVTTGYGVEDVITDTLAVRIMENEAVPEFRNDDYGEGLIKAAAQYAAVLGGETYDTGISFNLGWVLVPIFAIVGLIILISFAVRLKCPRCGSRVTMSNDREVLSSDYSHSGIRKKDYVCNVCHHEFSRMIVIPMLVAKAGSGGGSSGWSFGGSSGWSSGGSSFGGFSGGSSGGGGGGGSW
jgi:uncharacterized protein